MADTLTIDFIDEIWFALQLFGKQLIFILIDYQFIIIVILIDYHIL